MRDFLASRVVGGRQQIRTAITFHEYGRLVMWPYGYSYVDIPPDMTRDDHAALVTMGKHMAATNGYRPEQASDLYLTSGTTRDYEYGTYRIFSYTFELSNRDYPNQSWIGPETARNKEAVLYLAERAGCPLAVLGLAVRAARCGAFDDDLEVDRGWTVNPDGTDTATSGAFARADPKPTASNGPKQLGNVTSGAKALVTGAAAGATADANDLDGLTTVRSTAIDLPAAPGQRFTFRYVFAHGANSSARRPLRGDRRGLDRDPDDGLPAERLDDRRRRGLAIGVRVARPVGGNDDPRPIPGGRRRQWQPRRSRGRRRPGDATELRSAARAARARTQPRTSSTGSPVSWRAATRCPANAARRSAAGRSRASGEAAANAARKPASKASPAPVVSVAVRPGVATSYRRVAPPTSRRTVAPFAPRLTTASGASFRSPSTA